MDNEPTSLKELDAEISSLQSQMFQLQSRERILFTTCLAAQSSETLTERLRQAALSDKPALGDGSAEDEQISILNGFLPRSDAQARHTQECLYRLGAGATMFEVKNPDPNAVDGGKMFGVRIEVFVNGGFLPPHYILLNRPTWTSPSLRIHRHTIPPCIPIAALATKYLPNHDYHPHLNNSKSREQNLPKFIRTIRRELVSYHLRLSSIAALRISLGLDTNIHGQFNRSLRPLRQNNIKNVTLSSDDALDFRFELKGGQTGRAVLGKEGKLRQCVVMGENGRDRDVEKVIMGGDKHIEGLEERCLWLE